MPKHLLDDEVDPLLAKQTWCGAPQPWPAGAGMNTGGGALGVRDTVSTHAPLSLILLVLEEGILPGGGDSDLARLMLCVGSCQDWRPQTRWEGACHL